MYRPSVVRARASAAVLPPCVPACAARHCTSASMISATLEEDREERENVLRSWRNILRPRLFCAGFRATRVAGFAATRSHTSSPGARAGAAAKTEKQNAGQHHAGGSSALRCHASIWTLYQSRIPTTLTLYLTYATFIHLLPLPPRTCAAATCALRHNTRTLTALFPHYLAFIFSRTGAAHNDWPRSARCMRAARTPPAPTSGLFLLRNVTPAFATRAL